MMRTTKMWIVTLAIIFLTVLVFVTIFLWPKSTTPSPTPSFINKRKMNTLQSDECTDFVTCTANCQKTPTEHNRIVAFVPNFDSDYPGFHSGMPQNYTHAIIGFIVPYHVYMGSNSWDGCSSLCNVSYGSYFQQGPSGDAASITKQMVITLLGVNPQLKILLSFGGWNLDNLGRCIESDAEGNCTKSITGCEYICDGDVDPLALYWTNWDGTPYDQTDTKCRQNNDQTIFPSDFCASQTVTIVADNIIKLVEGIGGHGVDIDFENTKVYNLEPGNTKRQLHMDYIVNLTKMLRKKKPNYIITHSPMSPYVVKNDEFYNAYLFYTDVLQKIKNDVDFINVQFYNNPPEDSDPSAAQSIITAYNDIVTIMGSASKVTVGLCAVKENKDVCTYCSTEKFPAKYGNASCSDPTARITNIIKPLSQQYDDAFGGIMFWNTAGDDNGVFSTPFADFFRSQT